MIQIASFKDIKELLDLENEVFDKSNFPLSKSSFYYHVKNSHLFIFKIDNTIVGYILWLKRKSYFRLYSLAIKTEFRAKGIAKELLEYSFKNLKDKYYTLEVKCENEKAINLYKRYGFEVIKILKEYYPNKKDGYLMKKL